MIEIPSNRDNPICLLIDTYHQNVINNFYQRNPQLVGASYQDQINSINQLWEEQKMISPDSTISRDIIAIANDNNQSTNNNDGISQISNDMDDEIPF